MHHHPAEVDWTWVTYPWDSLHASFGGLPLVFSLYHSKNVSLLQVRRWLCIHQVSHLLSGLPSNLHRSHNTTIFERYDALLPWSKLCWSCQRLEIQHLQLTIRTSVAFGEEIYIRHPISNRFSSPILMTSLRLGAFERTFSKLGVNHAYRFTMIAPSSMMHPAPMTIGPAIAKIVALGCTMVPRMVSERILVRLKWYTPAPIVMSPFNSTSWHTIALEWIVNLSRLPYGWSTAEVIMRVRRYQHGCHIIQCVGGFGVWTLDVCIGFFKVNACSVT